MKNTVLRHLAQTLQAYHNCLSRGNQSMADEHAETIEKIVKDHMPSGSGIDSGVDFDWTSTPNKIIMSFGFHHLRDGMYIRWTHHKIIVTPSLVTGYYMQITGPNFDRIKSYLYQTFSAAFDHDLEIGG